MDMEVAGLDPTEWAGNTPYFLCTSLRGGKKAEIDHWKSLKQHKCRRQLRYKGRRRPEDLSHPNKVCTIFGAYGDSRAFLKRRGSIPPRITPDGVSATPPGRKRAASATPAPVGVSERRAP